MRCSKHANEIAHDIPAVGTALLVRYNKLSRHLIGYKFAAMSTLNCLGRDFTRRLSMISPQRAARHVHMNRPAGQSSCLLY